MTSSVREDVSSPLRSAYPGGVLAVEKERRLLSIQDASSSVHGHLLILLFLFQLSLFLETKLSLLLVFPLALILLSLITHFCFSFPACIEREAHYFFAGGSSFPRAKAGVMINHKRTGSAHRRRLSFMALPAELLEETSRQEHRVEWMHSRGEASGCQEGHDACRSVTSPALRSNAPPREHLHRNASSH